MMGNNLKGPAPAVIGLYLQEWIFASYSRDLGNWQWLQLPRKLQVKMDAASTFAK